MIQLAPHQRIELAEERCALFIPAPPEIARQLLQPLMRRDHQVLRRPRLAHDRRQLRRRRRQRPYIVLAEAAWLRCLHDEHALQHAAIDDWNPEEGAIRLLTGVAEVP